MTCGVCGEPCETTRHDFIVGSFERPSERWSIVAPMHFKATTDGRGCAVPFCGLGCATAHFLSAAHV